MRSLCSPRLPGQTRGGRVRDALRCFLRPLLSNTCLCPVPLSLLPARPPTPTAPLHAIPSASAAAEIIMFDDVVVVYKFIGDLLFYVTGHQDENEVRALKGQAERLGNLMGQARNRQAAAAVLEAPARGVHRLGAVGVRC